jgi:hypothetical protein
MPPKPRRLYVVLSCADLQWVFAQRNPGDDADMTLRSADWMIEKQM